MSDVFCQYHSQYIILASLGVLPQKLYHFCGSTPTPEQLYKRHWEYYYEVLPEAKNNITLSTPRTSVGVVQITLYSELVL